MDENYANVTLSTTHKIYLFCIAFTLFVFPKIDFSHLRVVLKNEIDWSNDLAKTKRTNVQHYSDCTRLIRNLFRKYWNWDFAMVLIVKIGQLSHKHYIILSFTLFHVLYKALVVITNSEFFSENLRKDLYNIYIML